VLVHSIGGYWTGIHNNTNNNQIYIAPYGHDFRGAGGMSDQCSEKA